MSSQLLIALGQIHQLPKQKQFQETSHAPDIGNKGYNLDSSYLISNILSDLIVIVCSICVVALKLGWINLHNYHGQMGALFLWVTWIAASIAGSNHRKSDNPICIFKNANHGFRTRFKALVNIRLSQ